ncbi:MAG: cellulose biosynthesis protein BcsS [Acidobacteriota bacterium]
MIVAAARAAAALALLAPGIALAGDTDVASGWEGGTARGYAYLFPAFSFHLAGKSSLVISGGPSFYYYETGGGAKVSSPGFEASLMLGVETSRLWFRTGPGIEGRKTTLHEPSGNVETDEKGATWKTALVYRPSPLWTFSGLGSYGAVNEYAWLRLGVGRRITDTSFTGRRSLSLGGEATIEGNADSREVKAGAVLDLAWLRPYTSIQIRAGASTSSTSGDGRARAYVGVGLYRRF